MKKLVTISSINFKDSPTVRYELNDDAVREYAGNYTAGLPMPPPILYDTDLHGLLVADGMHRLTALRGNQAKQVLCDIRQGTRADCFNSAVQTILAHGVRRTNAEKRQAIITAISIYPEIADLKIAELCHVSHSTVTDVRKHYESTGAIKKRETIKTADGKTRSSKNSDNGRPASASAPARSSVPAANNGAADTAPVVDATGFPIPEKALPIWNNRIEPLKLIDTLRGVRAVLSIAEKQKDCMYSEVNLNAADCELESLISRLQSAVPYAVCPACHGKLPEKCTNCGHRGMVSRTKFERTDPALLKVRALASSKRLSR